MRSANALWVPGGASYGTSTKYGVAIHCTANTASALAEAKYQNNRGDGTSAQFIVDATQVIQCLDTQMIAGHAGSTRGNRNAIAIEFCGLVNWTRDMWLHRVAWDKIAKVIRDVCLAHSILPWTHRTPEEMRANSTVKGYYTHNDMRLAWGGTDHTDPGRNFPLDYLQVKVREQLAAPTPKPKPAVRPPYRTDLSKIPQGCSGAYQVLEYIDRWFNPYHCPVTSDLRRPYGSSVSWHNKGNAVDFAVARSAAGDKRMRDASAWWWRFRGYLTEFIHSTPYSTDNGFYVKNGKVVPGSFYGEPNASNNGGHMNHYHVAATWTQAIAILRILEAEAK